MLKIQNNQQYQQWINEQQQYKMYFKLTTRRQDNRNNNNVLAVEQIASNRTFSFSQPAHGFNNLQSLSQNICNYPKGVSYNDQQSEIQVVDFVNSLLTLQQIHNTCVPVSHATIVNSADVVTVQETLMDPKIDQQIRNRMEKYVKLVYFISYQNTQSSNTTFQKQNNFETISKQHLQLKGKQQKQNSIKEPLAKFGSSSETETAQLSNNKKIKININIDQQPKNQNNENKLTIQKQGNGQYTKQNETRQKNQQKLVASRYIYREDQINQNAQKKIKQMTPKNTKNRSLSINSSQTSQSKPFHKIQLKSVKRLENKKKEKQKTKQFPQNEDKRQQHQQYQTTKIVNKEAGETFSKSNINENVRNHDTKPIQRYTISHQNRQKDNLRSNIGNNARIDRTISNQLNGLKSSSRLKVSRMKNNLANNSLNLCENSRITSRSRCKHEQRQVSPKATKDRVDKCQKCNRNTKNELCCCLQNRHSRINRQNDWKGYKNIDIQIDLTSNNLVYETVQKSTDFLQMLRMMSQPQNQQTQ